jgi:uncharacterized protein
MLRSSPSPGTLLRSVVWRNLATHGSEYCSLWQINRGWLLQGTVVAAQKDGRPMLADYEIECDLFWYTRRVITICRVGSSSRVVDLTVEASGIWRIANQEHPALRSCIDIDLAVSPATNTLPIRRLNLEVGQSAAVTAAWLKFPDLTLELLPQSYARIDAHRYRYQSGTGFSAELQVDDLGLITSYPGGWERAGQV